MQKALTADRNISFKPHTFIHSAERLGADKVRIDFQSAGLNTSKIYPVVVNCLWDDRLRVDGTAGITSPIPWLFRYKATIRLKTTNGKYPDLPSSTGMLGTYGDIVNYSDGSFYFSWYPVCKTIQTTSENGRSLHERLHHGVIRKSLYELAKVFPGLKQKISAIGHRHVVERSLEALMSFIPSVAELMNHPYECELGGGVIYALGATDIDDPSSHLHRRYEIGPVAHDSYITVDTGKYCKAPMIAVQTAAMVEEILR